MPGAKRPEHPGKDHGLVMRQTILVWESGDFGMERWPNEQRTVRLMVRVLWEHPSEWLSFQRLSRLIGVPDCDSFVIATIAANWPNLFVIHNDKRFKLQRQVVEEIAKKGIEKWKIPARPKPTRGRSRGPVPFTSAGIHSGPCYSCSQHHKILDTLRTGSIPAQVLACNLCWREICRVRGLYFNSVDPELWEEICRRRGYILRRQNPKGF